MLLPPPLLQLPPLRLRTLGVAAEVPKKRRGCQLSIRKTKKKSLTSGSSIVTTTQAEWLNELLSNMTNFIWQKKSFINASSSNPTLQNNPEKKGSTSPAYLHVHASTPMCNSYVGLSIMQAPSSPAEPDVNGSPTWMVEHRGTRASQPNEHTLFNCKSEQEKEIKKKRNGAVGGRKVEKKDPTMAQDPCQPLCLLSPLCGVQSNQETTTTGVMLQDRQTKGG